ncbi:hypothetical protein GGX14DRAFT_565344 [Mycena pura]|uniref:Uncharacterized protein n=1 Tax=Mycena pura TaxID=153505 RepID=A0AAD6YAS8_9AGAR|nr:hypothetical protein GGX14DRAFT_565344 [Mycena pura]
MSWTLWKLVASVFGAYERDGLPLDVGQEYTGYIPVHSPPKALRLRSCRPSMTVSVFAYRLFLLLLFFGTCVVDVFSAPRPSSTFNLGKRSYDTAMGTSHVYPENSASSSSTPSHSTWIHGIRQCDWRETGIQCTRHTLDINVALCPVHQVCASYVPVVPTTDNNNFDKVSDSAVPPHKRSKGKEKETQHGSASRDNEIRAVYTASADIITQLPATSGVFVLFFALLSLLTVHSLNRNQN